MQIFKNKKFIVFMGLGLGLLILGIGIFLYFVLSKEEESQISDSDVIQIVNESDTLKDEDDYQEFKSKWDNYIDSEDASGNISAYLSYALGEGARYDCNTAIMKVGEETLYGCDLNVQFVMKEFQNYISGELEDEVLQDMIDEAVIQSGILQKGEELGIITLDDTFYNSPDKSMAKRFQKVEDVREEFESSYIKRLDYEVITIYFHNQQKPENLTLEQAKSIAMEKISILHDRLKRGEITMEEAGNELLTDNITDDTTGVSISELDPVYQQNVYTKAVGREYGVIMFKDNTADKVLKSLGEGEISDILTLKDYEFTMEEWAEASTDDSFPLVDSCYVVIQLSDVKNGKSGTSIAESIDNIDEVILEEYKNKLIITNL